MLGRRADDLEPAFLDVPAGDHIFIGGAGRTGTSTVLAQVAAAWRSLEGERSVGGVAAGPAGVRMLDELAGGAAAGNRGRLLLVIDDAHRVDDTDGAIATILKRSDGVDHDRRGGTARRGPVGLRPLDPRDRAEPVRGDHDGAG